MLQLIDGITSILPTSALGSYVCFFVLFIVVAIFVYLMTKNRVISCGVGVVCEVVLTVVYLIRRSSFEGLFGDFLNALSLISRYDNLLNQTLELSTLFYYVSVAAVFCFLTVQVIQKRRWS